MARMAHFRGKYNRSKSKVILLLAESPDKWFSCARIAWITGVPIGSVRNIVRRLHWCSPPYIRRRLVGNYYPGPWHYEWQLGVRGGNWLNNAYPFMPIDEYVKEIKTWQRQRDGQDS